MMMANEEGLVAYIQNITRQLESWLLNGAVQKLVLVIKGVETGDTLERWVFNCEVAGGNENAKSDRAIKEITSEIQAIIRRILHLSHSCRF